MRSVEDKPVSIKFVNDNVPAMGGVVSRGGSALSSPPHLLLPQQLLQPQQSHLQPRPRLELSLQRQNQRSPPYLQQQPHSLLQLRLYLMQQRLNYPQQRPNYPKAPHWLHTIQYQIIIYRLLCNLILNKCCP
jgi:hypothetical protein